ncbi:MAG TPA: hypothetical protein VK969_01500 [Acidimicrobiia bacterium]|nr:hypothetical protein [Acidimicrobiia bacterium]
MSTRQVADHLLREAEEQLRRVEELWRPLSLMERQLQELAEIYRLPADELAERVREVQEIEDSMKLALLNFAVSAPSARSKGAHCDTCACDQPASPDVNLNGPYL